MDEGLMEQAQLIRIVDAAMRRYVEKMCPDLYPTLAQKYPELYGPDSLDRIKQHFPQFFGQ
jgi:hypothetical protein